jgi:hypothetical protein
MSNETKEYIITLHSINDSSLRFYSAPLTLTQEEYEDKSRIFSMGGFRFEMELDDGSMLYLSARQMKYFAAQIEEIEADD